MDELTEYKDRVAELEALVVEVAELERVAKGHQFLVTAYQRRAAELEAMWQEEHAERLRLEERLKMLQARYDYVQERLRAIIHTEGFDG